LFTKQELMKEKNADLKAKCRKYNIVMGLESNKEELVAKIVSCNRTINTQWAAIHNLFKVLKRPVLKDLAPLHNFYGSHFNFDNLIDHKWYAVEECHSNHSWKSKFLLSILCFAVYDTCAYDTKVEY